VLPASLAILKVEIIKGMCKSERITRSNIDLDGKWKKYVSGVMFVQKRGRFHRYMDSSTSVHPPATLVDVSAPRR
jgi:hypothetical protein